MVRQTLLSHCGIDLIPFRICLPLVARLNAHTSFSWIRPCSYEKIWWILRNPCNGAPAIDATCQALADLEQHILQELEAVQARFFSDVGLECVVAEASSAGTSGPIVGDVMNEAQ
jgi:hypothetical protein